MNTLLLQTGVRTVRALLTGALLCTATALAETQPEPVTMNDTPPEPVRPVMKVNERVETAREKVKKDLEKYFGRPVFIRIHKEERQLELWMQESDGDWVHEFTYEIQGMSGQLGPKIKQGDLQAPEGFYYVTPRMMNPLSKYHLSFNIGYPNDYDRMLRRTGGHIMVHGSNVSAGCFAMGDDGIDEIYTLVHEALAAGQPSVPVQVYPFRMTEERMAGEKDNPHYPYWQLYLQPGWEYTEDEEAPYTAPAPESVPPLLSPAPVPKKAEKDKGEAQDETKAPEEKKEENPSLLEQLLDSLNPIS